MEDNYNSSQLDRLVNEIEGRLNDFDSGITNKDETIKSFAELILVCVANQSKAKIQSPVWFDINKKLPNEHYDVLGIDNEGDMKVCWLDGYNNGFYMTVGDDQLQYKQINITHWTELPKF